MSNTRRTDQGVLCKVKGRNTSRLIATSDDTAAKLDGLRVLRDDQPVGNGEKITCSCGRSVCSSCFDQSVSLCAGCAELYQRPRANAEARREGFAELAIALGSVERYAAKTAKKEEHPVEMLPSSVDAILAHFQKGRIKEDAAKVAK